MEKLMEAAKEYVIPDEDLAQVDEMGRKRSEILSEIKKVIVGQEKVIEEVLIALFCKGHCLLVGVPGLAKTLLMCNAPFSGDGVSLINVTFLLNGRNVLAKSEKSGSFAWRGRCLISPAPVYSMQLK